MTDRECFEQLHKAAQAHSWHLDQLLLACEGDSRLAFNRLLDLANLDPAALGLDD